MRVESHRDLIAWQKAIRLVVCSYRLSQSFPADERFGLTQQLRRSAVSVAANIAEGKGRGTSSEFARFLNIANGSLTELDTHFVIARELGYLDQASWDAVALQIEEVGRIMTGLRKSLG